MERVTVSIESEQLALIDELSQDNGPCDNRSESMRYVIDSYEKDRDFEQEVRDLENRLDESRNREIARDNTQEQIAQLRQDLEQEQQSDNAPWPVEWYRWFKNR
jgi:Arc/MetJ-type ribon-helix-helix transcriptional regulator